ncbi:MAG: septum formation inhibitor Maf [Aldersonia sp.]|nr:septum formation inhibitor Maf [Aldersonia sp.]
MTRLVLASASPARLSVLRAAGVEPVVRVSDVDEDAVADALPLGTDEDTVVIELARAKARAVLMRLADDPAFLDDDGFPNDDYVVVGCDSMLSIAGQLQGKPLTADSARQRWSTMAGQSGRLLTGHCVLRPRPDGDVAEAAACSATTVHFGAPAPAELDAYLATGEPLQVAGAFTLDGYGGWFVERIEGDPSSVIGIGLPLLRSLLAEVELSVDRLWAAR